MLTQKCFDTDIVIDFERKNSYLSFKEIKFIYLK